MIPYIDQSIEPQLDWLALSDALRAGHDLPRAEVADSFVRRGQDTLLVRSAWIDGLGSLVKAATVTPANPGRGLPRINGAATVFDDVTGQAVANIDIHLLTNWKTAADSLAGARALARPNSRTLLIVGAGVVATSMVSAYRAAFPHIQIKVWNRTPAKAESFANTHQVEAVADLATAVSEADIITCATMAAQPVLRGEWLQPGQHIDLIGAFRADLREADDEALKRSRIFVDSRETTLDHIGELAIPLDEGVISEGDVLADFYDADRFARTSAEEITLFKNGGGAHLDLMTARYILSKAEQARD